MGKKKPKKRKKDEEDAVLTDSGDSELSLSEAPAKDEEEEDLYRKPYRVTDYSRRYPEDSMKGMDYIVFVESSVEKPIGSRDMISLNNCLTRFIKGIKYLKKINKFKMGVVFDTPNLANAFLDNVTFLKEYCLRASIPASSAEVTGVVRIPTDMSNKKIFEALSSSKKIICVRRLLKKSFSEGKPTLVPTQTVAITFASSSSLPDYVYLKKWRLQVDPYIPPIKQCYKCLRYGHLAKFCKNSVRCSICSEPHSFKDCNENKENAKCVHCEGNHISISGACPIKQKKIQEMKNKASPSPFASLFDSKNFPLLSQTDKSKKDLALLLGDQKFLNLIIESVIKIITLNKTTNTSISTKTVSDVLHQTFSDKTQSSSPSQGLSK